MGYLADKYDASGKWFPKDAAQRARITQRMFLDFNLFAKFAEYAFAKLRNQPQDPAALESFKQYMGFLDGFLEKERYVAGNDLTIADISMYCSVLAITLCNQPIDAWSNVKRWLEHIQKTVSALPNDEQTEAFTKMVVSRLK